MPILNQLPFRAQYFENADCPEDLIIPSEDDSAWPMFPDHNWVYNKLSIALSQGLEAAPHGVPPLSFPVFSKPIMNLFGMGANSMAIPDEETYRSLILQPGHFWSTLLTGPHVSTDVAVVDGEIVWSRHTTGLAGPQGTFDHWHVHKEAMPEVENWLRAWSRKHLAGYTGMANFETIGGKIIEAHLRFADQWPDLNGEGWIKALIRLYAEKCWEYDDSERKDGYSVVLWGPHGRTYQHPSATALAKARALPFVKSVQITFHDDRDPSFHMNPPGGFRIAIVNATDLEAGRAAIRTLREAIVDVESDVVREPVFQFSSL
ncbi:hypothetical protein BGX28_005788 [Mortierella sp. GBA30]|nr:hypothetical protein BGX28_005788 [Mortierella sp. GBA30]